MLLCIEGNKVELIMRCCEVKVRSSLTRKRTVSMLGRLDNYFRPATAPLNAKVHQRSERGMDERCCEVKFVILGQIRSLMLCTSMTSEALLFEIGKPHILWPHAYHPASLSFAQWLFTVDACI